MTFHVRFAPGTFNATTTLIDILMDTDLNTATGHPGTDNSCTNDAAVLGSDYIARAGGGVANVAPSPSCNAGGAAQAATVVTLSDGMDVTFPLSAIGGDDGQLRFKVITYTRLSPISTTGIQDRLTGIGQPALTVLPSKIDTMANFAVTLAAAGSLLQGGTFVAGASPLAEFTLIVFAQDGTLGRAVVLAAPGGTPSGAPLWQGPEIQWPLGLPLRPDGYVDLTYQPNIPLVTGQTYFLGIDYGLFGTGFQNQIFFIGRRLQIPYLADGRGHTSGKWLDHNRRNWRRPCRSNRDGSSVAAVIATARAGCRLTAVQAAGRHPSRADPWAWWV